MGRRARLKKHNIKLQDETSSDVINLLKWLRLRNNFKVTFFSGTGRGVLTKRAIARNEELCAVPLKFMITLDHVLKDGEVTMLPRNVADDTQTALAVYLLLQRHLGSKSYFYNYLQMLPKVYSNLWYCPEMEKKFLPKWMLQLVNERIKSIEEQYDCVKKSCEPLTCNHCGCSVNDIVTYEQFVWAWTTVNTRAVYFESSGYQRGKKVNGEMALAPYIDIFNHSGTADVEVTVDRERSVYILKTKRPFKKNEQVFIKYGAHSNQALLLEYGFVMDTIDQDAVQFTIDEILKAAAKIDRSYGDVTKLKYKFIKIHRLNENLIKTKDGFSWNCDGLLYILVTRDCDLNNILTKTYSTIPEKNEKSLIEKIKIEVIRQKHMELSAQLAEMNRVQNCSEGFSAAKKLVEQFISILET